jgi:hypothetical protein
MARRPTWVFWTRGSLIGAISGHWLANVLLDGDQYSEVGLRYSWRASVPLIVQTILVLVVLVLLKPMSERRNGGPAPPRSTPLRPARSLMLVTASQLLLFLLMEVSERIYQGEPFTEGLLASGFPFELVIAIASSLLLIGLGSVALRMMRAPRRRPTTRAIEDRLGPISHQASPSQALIVVGDVRAPPPLPA